MRILPLLLATAFLLTAMPAVADHDGRPHEDACKQRERPCTDVQAGTMSCLPEEGEAAGQLSSVVGSADQGTFKLIAKGTSRAETGVACVFEIRIRANEARFNEGWTVGLLAPYGAITSTTTSPCVAYPGQACEASATFSWWRAQHGVTFDVPFDLVVNNVVVARGECHYYDPPMMEAITGGPIAL